MFPKTRQRLLVCLTIAVGALGWLMVIDALRAPDGSSGLMLVGPGPVQTLKAFLIVAVLGLPAMALGLITSVTGNPLSGIFALASALGILAICGGPIDGVLRRMAAADQLPASYALLMLEMLIWQVGVVIILLLVQHLRSPLHARWPALSFDDHLGVDTHIRLPQFQALGAGLVCAVVGGGLSWVFIRSNDSGQVICSLVLAFMLGGLIGQITFPQNNPVGILFSPALVALISYGIVFMSYKSTDEFLLAWFNLNVGTRTAPRLPGPALALPIHYVSAGIAGCALGVGWGQVTTGEVEPAGGAVEGTAEGSGPS